MIDNDKVIALMTVCEMMFSIFLIVSLTFYRTLCTWPLHRLCSSVVTPRVDAYSRQKSSRLLNGSRTLILLFGISQIV